MFKRYIPGMRIIDLHLNLSLCLILEHIRHMIWSQRLLKIKMQIWPQVGFISYSFNTYGKLWIINIFLTLLMTHAYILVLYLIN